MLGGQPHPRCGLRPRSEGLGRDRQSRNNLAVAHREAGQLAEAIPLFESTLADYERVLGDTYPSTLLSRNNLAVAYQDAGRLAEAEALHRRAECEP